MKLIFELFPQATKACVLGSRSRASAVVGRGGRILGAGVAMAAFLFVGLFGPVAAHAQTTPSIIAVAESGTATMGTASTPIANVAANDTINGLPATLGAGGNATVAESGTWPTDITLNTTTGAVTTTATVPAGVYNVTYQLCDRNSPANCNTATDVITVNALATLTITKLAVNGGAAIPFTVSGGLTASFNLNPNPPSTPTQSQVFTNVSPGQAITITEYEPATSGFDLVNITCSNASGAPTGSTVSTSITNTTTTGQPSGTATVNLVPGANLTCTFTNLRNPTIVIVKEAIGGDNTFNFAVSATAGTVADPSINITTSAGVGAFNTSVKLTGGVTTTNVTLTESTPPAGYVLTALACTNMTTGAPVGTVTLASRQVVLTGLVGADEVGCKFTNETRRLTLRKTWVNGRIGDAITVTTTGGSANATVTSTSTGNNTTTGTTVNVNTGNITLPAETFTTGSQSNYATTVSCTGNATPLAGSTLPQTLTIGATDTNVVCTYTNTGSIVAVNDGFAVSPDVSAGATTASVVANDTVNGNAVTLGANATLNISGTAQDGTTTLGLTSSSPNPAPGSITMNADGTLTVAPNTTQGSYDYVYEICALPATTPPTCDTATATVTVNATVPITLASVDSRQEEAGLWVQWTTATETRNAGFHLYGRKAGEPDWLPLTATLVPSQVIDSLEPQRYTATFPGVMADELLIEGWDTQGQTERHGPFAVGRQHGFDAVAAAKSLDWAAIHVENTQTARQTQKALSRATRAAEGPNALLWVTEPGVQRVSFDELQAAGARFDGVAIADLALTDAGKKYPRHVIDDNGNGRFDSGDAVEFLGEVTPTLYSARNAYRLLEDRGQVRDANSKALDLKNAVAGVFTDDIKVEQQRAYSFAAPGNDPWYDQWLFARAKPVRLERAFDLPGYAGGEARLTLRHWGVTDWPGDAPDHHLIVKVNGQQVDEDWFDGSVDASRTLVLPGLGLQSTGNTLTLEAPGDTGYLYDIQALDNFSVQYPRHTQAHEGAWRGELPSDAKTLITGFQGESVAWRDGQRRVGAEQLIVNGQGLWVAADSRAIRRPTIQADPPTPAAAPTAKAVDYLIISHPLFVDSAAMTDLVALQQGRGHRTAVVDVDTIYAAYSDFEVSADAISRYLKQAKPRFALLVGGDSNDYHNYLGLASQSFIPTHYAQTVAPVTYAPADGRYVDYNNDGKPQAALGRLPVRTVAELSQLVTKLVNYVPPTHAVLGAGPSDGGSHQYTIISESYAAQLPATTWTDQLVAVDDLGLTDAKTTLKTELNQGDALISYMGHSSYAMWGLNASGILLSATEARQLSNATPLLVTQWGCWNTYFVNPKQDTMANAFLFQSHGAAAVLGATALTDINILSGLGDAFFQQLGQSTTLGEALQAAQRTYLNQNPAAASKLRGFALLGDPAAEVR
ncbi:MAG: hypothetical protein KDJ54_01035 [Candidatus Competibacteraceae bacterium]|nr:hypothetical protein [Candidatus Competibacteraceae bacterium]